MVNSFIGGYGGGYSSNAMLQHVSGRKQDTGQRQPGELAGGDRGAGDSEWPSMAGVMAMCWDPGAHGLGNRPARVRRVVLQAVA